VTSLARQPATPFNLGKRHLLVDDPIAQSRSPIGIQAQASASSSTKDHGSAGSDGTIAGLAWAEAHFVLDTHAGSASPGGRTCKGRSQLRAHPFHAGGAGRKTQPLIEHGCREMNNSRSENAMWFGVCTTTRTGRRCARSRRSSSDQARRKPLSGAKRHMRHPGQVGGLTRDAQNSLVPSLAS